MLQFHNEDLDLLESRLSFLTKGFGLAILVSE